MKQLTIVGPAERSLNQELLALIRLVANLFDVLDKLLHSGTDCPSAAFGCQTVGASNCTSLSICAVHCRGMRLEGEWFRTPRSYASTLAIFWIGTRL
jgi:hypothetical protein